MPLRADFAGSGGPFRVLYWLACWKDLSPDIHMSTDPPAIPSCQQKPLVTQFRLSKANK